ncbi:8-oxo-dGTP diphosphatase [Nanoarchaeota archaeon]
MRQVTLCLLLKDNKVLLGLKKRGFGAGRYNGFGGKPEGKETLPQTAVRELEQESGVIADESYLTEVAGILFRFPDNPEWDQHMHVYLVDKWHSTPGETEEMQPEWFSRDTLPYGQMWAGDRHWLPLVLDGNYVVGRFVYSADQEVLEKLVNYTPMDNR